jgi:tetraacyldisaccharide 4'-kinase
VGGATLGGSGKTPLAIACAAELARAGARPVLVGHAYRARPERPRLVHPFDPLGEVGDEALVAAQALVPLGAKVVVAPSRALALAFAAGEGDVLVVDGVAQLAPVPADLALLAVDAGAPWGSCLSIPPLGGLRAPVSSLLAVCDGVVVVGGDSVRMLERSESLDGPRPAGRELGTMVSKRGSRPERAMWPARVESRGAWAHGGVLLKWEILRTLRVGLITAIARPARLLGLLSGYGVVPEAVVATQDHGPFGWRARRQASLAHARRRLDLWLATPKCVPHASAALPALPLAVLDHSLALDAGLHSRLRALCLEQRESADLHEAAPHARGVHSAKTPASFAIPSP